MYMNANLCFPVQILIKTVVSIDSKKFEKYRDQPVIIDDLSIFIAPNIRMKCWLHGFACDLPVKRPYEKIRQSTTKLNCCLMMRCFGLLNQSEFSQIRVFSSVWRSRVRWNQNHVVVSSQRQIKLQSCFHMCTSFQSKSIAILAIFVQQQANRIIPQLCKQCNNMVKRALDRHYVVFYVYRNLYDMYIYICIFDVNRWIYQEWTVVWYVWCMCVCVCVLKW